MISVRTMRIDYHGYFRICTATTENSQTIYMWTYNPVNAGVCLERFSGVVSITGHLERRICKDKTELATRTNY